MDSKRIRTFKQYLKEKLNEENIYLEIDWWEEAEMEVLDDLTRECNGLLSWEDLIRYINTKNAILGKESKDFDQDGNLLNHIKELIFNHHGDSLCFGDGIRGSETATIHSKGLAIEQLANEILDKVREKTKSQVINIPAATLQDEEPEPFVNDDIVDYYEDLPFESKKVLGYKDYSKLLKESTENFQLKNKKKVIRDTLNRLEQEAGSLDIDKITELVLNKKGGKATPDDVKQYIKDIVSELIMKEGDVIASLQKKEDTYVSKNVARGLIDFMATLTLEEVLHIILNKEQEQEGIGNEEVE